ncbi:hypothetical protein EJ08DRAFT_661818 [Tothia fuscella]|uniref:Uncharacterized protein n=1 Tax=Tothia fuscella TaxID=1048955 RepID=A0A9P4NQ47_9PEZI|nr:hypothetical protein EJ08DRAFT_661818 [Tothia fuscella]
MAMQLLLSAYTRRILYGITIVFVFVSLVWWQPYVSTGTWLGSSTATSSSVLSSSSLDIVVSMYKEDIHNLSVVLRDVQSLPPIKSISRVRTFIYVKDVEANIPMLQDALATSNVIQLPNAGRESGTFLTHIISNYDNLAQHTLFVQAEPHEFENAKNRIIDYFIPSTGVLPLGILEVCDCTSCKDPWNPDRTFNRIEELYSILNSKFCPSKITLSYLGQMIASKERIRSRPRKIYEYLNEILEADQDHHIHKDSEGLAQEFEFFTDGPGNPYFGHTVERAWMLLWGLFGC